jgi:hypothetical protein
VHVPAQLLHLLTPSPYAASSCARHRAAEPWCVATSACPAFAPVPTRSAPPLHSRPHSSAYPPARPPVLRRAPPFLRSLGSPAEPLVHASSTPPPAAACPQARLARSPALWPPSAAAQRLPPLAPRPTYRAAPPLEPPLRPLARTKLRAARTRPLPRLLAQRRPAWAPMRRQLPKPPLRARLQPRASGRSGSLLCRVARASLVQSPSRATPPGAASHCSCCRLLLRFPPPAALARLGYTSPPAQRAGRAPAVA